MRTLPAVRLGIIGLLIVLAALFHKGLEFFDLFGVARMAFDMMLEPLDHCARSSQGIVKCLQTLPGLEMMGMAGCVAVIVALGAVAVLLLKGHFAQHMPHEPPGRLSKPEERDASHDGILVIHANNSTINVIFNPPHGNVQRNPGTCHDDGDCAHAPIIEILPNPQRTERPPPLPELIGSE
jgi:hypothetical protein